MRCPSPFSEPPPPTCYDSSFVDVSCWLIVCERLPSPSFFYQTDGDGLGHPCLFYRRRRYYIAILACVGYIVSYSTRVNLSIAILYMTEPYNVTVSNDTIIQKRECNWTEETQAIVLSSFFYGYVATQIPGGYLAGIIGGNHVFNIGILGSGLVSLLGPFFVKLSLGATIAVRVICGLFQGVTVPAVNCIWARWAPPLERTILSTIANSGKFFSSIIIMPICSIIGDRIGWEYTFYIFGVVSIIWSIIWGTTVYAGPEKDKFIKQSELNYIQLSIGEATNKRPIHPWKKIFSSMPVGACVVSQTGHNWGYYTVLLLGPKYYHETLFYSVGLSAIFIGVAFTISGLLMQICGHIQDIMRKKMKTVVVRNIFCVGGFFIQFIFMMALAFIKMRELCVAISILTIGLGGITWSAFAVNPLDIASPHAAIISGIANTFGTVSGILCPLVPSAFIKEKNLTAGDWMWVWFICGVVYVVSGVFFLIFSKGEKQSWVYTV